MAKRTTSPGRRLAVALARVCAENRCRDVVVLDVRGLSPVTDFFVLATGTSPRQMRSVVSRVEDAGRDLKQKPFGVEGTETRDQTADTRWILIDYVDVVINVFCDESRHFYDFELLWGDAPRVNWQRGWKPRADLPSPAPEGPDAQPPTAP